MTRDDALNVLAVLTAAFPRSPLPKETAQLWLGMLAELDVDDATAAARDAVRQDQWFPTIARFLQLTATRAHARQIKASAARGLPQPQGVAPPPKLVAAARRLIAERAGKEHNHHGEACPVCGPLSRPAGGTR